jgi:hypothetical protein
MSAPGRPKRFWTFERSEKESPTSVATRRVLFVTMMSTPYRRIA